MAIVKYIKGSILDAEQKYIAHGVNHQNTMGSGVAKVLYKKYPEVKSDYHKVFDVNRHNFIEDRDYLMGWFDYVNTSEDKIILNCWTQFDYGYDGKKYVSYDAIHSCFKLIAETDIKEVAIPKIGCGLAGGNWEIVSRIIDDATGDDLDVYVYEL